MASTWPHTWDLNNDNWKMFAEGNLPQCDDVNTCSNELHIIRAPSLHARYVYFYGIHITYVFT